MANLLNMSGGKLLKLPPPPRFVDLGLPSGKKWAIGNLVKDAQGNYSIGNETDYGCYFSWGNIVGHNANANNTFEDGYSFDAEHYELTPGASLTTNIYPDDIQHDAAAALLGGLWHMPTLSDFQELYDNTVHSLITVDGVNGVTFYKSSDPSKRVFFPMSGTGTTTLTNKTKFAMVWSSTIYTDNTKAGYMYVRYATGSVNFFNSIKHYGYVIRPVYN